MDKKNDVRKEYYALKGYQILAQLSDAQMAQKLGITTRTYQNKQKGISDFTQRESRIIEEILDRDQKEIFLTRNVSISERRKGNC